MANKKWIEKRVSVSFSKPEWDKLEAYCELQGRSYTDVIRELVRKLKIPKSEND
ncbi:MAG: plasmid partition protein ParG [Crinalium sp.]